MTESKELLALDLIIEDLVTKHLQIRNIAKELQCETELDVWRDELLSYMIEKRMKLQNIHTGGCA